MIIPLLMIGAAFGLGGFLLANRPTPPGGGTKRVALGNGYTLTLTPTTVGVHWVLTFDFDPSKPTATGDASTPEQAAIQARLAMATDIAQRNVSML